MSDGTLVAEVIEVGRTRCFGLSRGSWKAAGMVDIGESIFAIGKFGSCSFRGVGKAARSVGVGHGDDRYLRGQEKTGKEVIVYLRIGGRRRMRMCL